MNETEYADAYSEVLEILKYIPKEDYNKIPEKKIEMFESKSNKDYIFNYNPNKTLDEQNVSKIAKGIIAILFRDYWATDKQKQKIIAKQNYDRSLIEKEKELKYTSDNIFKKEKNENINSQTSIIKYKESFLKNIINKIKTVFKLR